jgi:hypothetical protein
MIRSAMALAVAGVVVLATGTASADEWDAMSICRSHQQNANVTTSEYGLHNADASNAAVVYCPLKVVTCASAPCTYNANAYGVDNNSTNAADANVTCSLNFKYRQVAGTHIPGSDVTVGSVGPMTTMPVSVTVTGAGTGLLYVKCSIGKGGSSYVTWFDL